MFGDNRKRDKNIIKLILPNKDFLSSFRNDKKDCD